MFTFDTIADGYAKTTRQVLNFMPNETVRDSLIALTDAQVKVAKNFYVTQQSANEKFLSAIKNYDWSKNTFFTK
jgi:hypothetical protein